MNGCSSPERNNFLAAVYPSGKIFGLALVDLTTGDFLTTELEFDAALLAELERLRQRRSFCRRKPPPSASCCGVRFKF